MLCCVHRKIDNTYRVLYQIRHLKMMNGADVRRVKIQTYTIRMQVFHRLLGQPKIPEKFNQLLYLVYIWFSTIENIKIIFNFSSVVN